jgi:hypothetical protein
MSLHQLLKQFLRILNGLLLRQVVTEAPILQIGLIAFPRCLCVIRIMHLAIILGISLLLPSPLYRPHPDSSRNLFANGTSLYRFLTG